MTSSARILVVDEDVKILASLERGLRLSGFRMEAAADGASAPRVVSESCPDAIVLDINMPGLDGVGVVTANSLPRVLHTVRGVGFVLRTEP